ncbi:hypothetical protein GCM10022408_10370 [Hymenobacter fastidiosus]|uniref:Uncharacterized protein n=1 Tax=Hymenobacter fastidiosus TaxID=486264 RepID=A0ABP7RR81_9BACT
MVNTTGHWGSSASAASRGGLGFLLIQRVQGGPVQVGAVGGAAGQRLAGVPDPQEHILEQVPGSFPVLYYALNHVAQRAVEFPEQPFQEGPGIRGPQVGEPGFGGSFERGNSHSAGWQRGLSYLILA